jgi:hypothetical protein
LKLCEHHLNLIVPFYFIYHFPPAQLIKNCFWDVAKDAAEAAPKGRWLKYTPRLVCHFIMDHLLSVHFANPQAEGSSLFTVDNFKKVLGRVCQSSRRLDVDNSDAIVWKSSPRDLVSWDRMGPMLVKIPGSNAGPQVEPEAIPELYAYARIRLDVKDIFFKSVVATPGLLFAQINHIIIARLILFVMAHPPQGFVPRNPPKKPIDASHLERVWLGDGLKLTRFFDSFKAADEVIKAVWKHAQKDNDKWKILKARAIVNRDMWCSHGERGIDILQLSGEQETTMTRLIQLADASYAFRKAERGHISRSFLLWLLDKKEWYNTTRLGGLGVSGRQPRVSEIRTHCDLPEGRG